METVAAPHYLERLRVVFFRNLPAATITLDPGLNILVGKNAQGKTAFLEAITCLFWGRSFRAKRENEWIGYDHPLAQVEGWVKTPSAQRHVRLRAERSKGKKIWLDGRRQTRIAPLLEILPIVVFSPEDLQLVQGEPAHRRKFLERVAVQGNPAFLEDLKNYYRALRQRNVLLRTGRPTDQELAVWEEPLAHYGARLMLERFSILEKIKEHASLAVKELTGGEEKFDISYQPHVVRMKSTLKDLSEELRGKLRENRSSDRLRKTTTIGPHRDEVLFELNQKPLRRFASQGQQRTTALALKLAEWRFLRETRRQEPLILFDDVMAELDEGRRSYFLAHLSRGGQAVLTGTDEAQFIGGGEDARVFYVEKGSVRLKKEAVENEGQER